MNFSTFSSKAYLAATAGIAVVIALAFLVASEWLIRTRVAPNQNYEQHAFYLKHTQRQSAAFGDSHVAMGVVGNDAVANLGFPADSLLEVIGKAGIYFRRVEPRQVILQADPQQLIPGRLDKSFEPVRSLFESDSSWASYFKLSIPIYRSNLLSHWQAFFRGAEFKSPRGFDVNDGSQTAETSIAGWSVLQTTAFIERVIEDQRHILISENHPTLQEYEALIRWLNAKGAAVCLVAYPVSAAFLREARRNATEAQSEDLYRRLAARTGSRYVNFRGNDFPDTFFYDPDHLNKAGALAFTPKLMRACFDRRS